MRSRPGPVSVLRSLRDSYAARAAALSEADALLWICHVIGSP